MRGQTTLDFAIGVSVFVVVLLFVFTFVPGILAPFEATDEEAPVLSDRIANSLTHGILGSPEEPHILDRYCTVEFFKETEAPGECNYDGQTVEERLNVGFGRSVNVTISDTQGELLCWDSDGDEPTLTDSCDGDTVLLATGDELPDREPTITSQRVVSLDGENVRMEVVVW